MLATQPIVQLLCLFTAYIYGIIYLVLATYPALWSAKYGQPVGTLSINYVSLGVGFSLGAQFCAALQDRVYVRLKRRGRDEAGRPEFRVPLMVPGAVLVPVGLLVYSWTAEARTHWIGPNVGAAVFAAGSIVTFQCVNGYVVDAYTRYAASAIGAITVLRSLAGFGFPLFAPYLYESLGYGRAGSVLAACAVAVGWPSPVLLWMYGARLRARSKFSG
ncbi:hypothetical protein CDD83_5281 [Cordyceps sp. RAO-2017]|nr:hypothetical protein CDD83_5281 [Cordyceps sp. RAO-2017]